MGMKGVNSVTILGNLGQDPEVKVLGNGNSVANISVATSETWKDKTTGQPQEKTQWHRIVVFGKLAEICGQYLRKGSKAYFVGKLQTRDYEKDGVKRYVTEIIVDSFTGQMQMLSDRGEHTVAPQHQQQQQQQQAPQQQQQQQQQPQQGGYQQQAPQQRQQKAQNGGPVGYQQQEPQQRPHTQQSPGPGGFDSFDTDQIPF